jgi:hypothetical protein
LLNFWPIGAGMMDAVTTIFAAHTFYSPRRMEHSKDVIQGQEEPLRAFGIYEPATE